jgi:hypothetical protein
VGDRIEELTALEHRLVLERTSSLTTMASKRRGFRSTPSNLAETRTLILCSKL